MQVNINSYIDGEFFTASGRQILNEWWKSVENDSQNKDDKKENDEGNSSAPLSEISQGENGSCNDINLLAKKTKAPSSIPSVVYPCSYATAKPDTIPQKGDFVQVPVDAFYSTDCVLPE